MFIIINLKPTIPTIMFYARLFFSKENSGENDDTWWYRTPINLHDNARSHIGTAVTDLLRRRQWEILEHPPYSPDLSPCDSDLFAKVKEPLREIRYNKEMNLSVLCAVNTEHQPCPSQRSFRSREESLIAWTEEKTTALGGTEPHHSS